MSILLIGGHDRMHSAYKDVATKYGHDIKVLTQRTPQFDKTLGNPDAIVLFTNTVSHQMVIAAVKKAKKCNIPVIRSHSSGAISLENSIKQLESTCI